MIPISEARASLSELVDRVQAGEELTFSRHGIAVAVLVRPDTLVARRAERALTEAGVVRELIEASRSQKLRDAPSLSPERAEELVEELRRDRAAR